MSREMSASSAMILFAASVLVACATTPAPTTHDEWLVRQMETWNSIRECNPELAMCHRRRERLNLSGGCFPPEYPYEARVNREEGRTRIRIDVEVDGTVSAVVLVRGSGHQSLDGAATKGFSACRFPANLKPQTPSGSRFFLEYIWQLENAQRPTLIQRVPG